MTLRERWRATPGWAIAGLALGVVAAAWLMAKAAPILAAFLIHALGSPVGPL